MRYNSRQQPGPDPAAAPARGSVEIARAGAIWFNAGMEYPPIWTPAPGVTLHNADCIDVLPTLAGLDAVITDPPYGIRERTMRKSNGRSNATAAIDWDPVIGDDRPFDPSPWIGFRPCVLWGANHYASRLPDMPSWLVWDKRDGGSSDDNADCEMAWTNYGRPARLFHHKWRGMIKASEQGEARSHPTQKPVALMAWCMDAVGVATGALVVDPYMGSASTGLACIRTGRRFIGIERDAGHYQRACARVAAELQQPFLLAPIQPALV